MHEQMISTETKTMRGKTKQKFYSWQCPIHAAMPNTVTILDTLAIILGMYHATLDLEKKFFFFF